MQDPPVDVVKSPHPPWGRPKAPRKPQRVPDGWIWVYDLIGIVGPRLFGDKWTGRERKARDLEKHRGVIPHGESWIIPISLHPDAGILVSRSRSDFYIRPASREACLQELEEFQRWKTVEDWLWQRFWGERLIASTIGKGMEPVASHLWSDNNCVEIAMRHGGHSTVGKGYMFVREAELLTMLDGPTDEDDPDNPKGAARTSTAETGRSVLKSDTETKYAGHVEAVRAATGRAPTIKVDEEWRKTEGLTQRAVRDLRRNSRSPEEKKGGYPSQS